MALYADDFVLFFADSSVSHRFYIFSIWWLKSPNLLTYTALCFKIL